MEHKVKEQKIMEHKVKEQKIMGLILMELKALKNQCDDVNDVELN